jgi:hypothetical protein
MSDNFVTVARYTSSIEAETARSVLEGDGIRAFVVGAGAADAFGGVVGLAGSIHLRVHEGDVEQANRILGEIERARLDPGWEDDAEDANVWVCSLCGNPVPSGWNVCPDCATPREAIREDRRGGANRDAYRRSREEGGSASPSLPDERVQSGPQAASDITEAAPAGEEPDEPVEDVHTFLSDDLARRGFIAAVLGFFFWPLVLYSFWLFVKLVLFPAELSPRGMRFFYGQVALLALDGLVIWLVLDSWGGLFGAGAW